MTKTSKQIQGDVFLMLRESTLCSMISGAVYRNGMRPRDSRKEDAVVIFSTGLSEEIQTGVVIVNLFVPDIDPASDGVFVEDGARVEELECLAQEWVDSLSTKNSCYRFELQQTIYSESDHELQQHVIVVRLKFWYYDIGN